MITSFISKKELNASEAISADALRDGIFERIKQDHPPV